MTQKIPQDDIELIRNLKEQIECGERHFTKDEVEQLLDVIAGLQHSPTDESPCSWSDNEEYWESSCGLLFTFFDGGPVENSFNFCPSCGKKIVVFYLPQSDDSEEDI